MQGGQFLRNNDPALPASVSPFRLDRYEVTVARFREFVKEYDALRLAGFPQAGAGAHPRIADSGWKPEWDAMLLEDAARLGTKLRCDMRSQTWTEEPGSNDTRPINCANWYEAFAFCAWDGGRLPTQAEWNYAAAGGDEQRVYPWSVPPESTEISYAHASYYDNDCLGDGMPGCGVTDFTTVGSKPLGDGRFGHADMAGNVREWVLDFIGEQPVPCVDCAKLTPAPRRVVRGGAWNNLAVLLTTYAELDDFAENHYFVIGFRCARDP